MKSRIMYIESKDASGDRGTAVIGRVTFSKSGRTVRYRDLELQRSGGQGIRGNHLDVATGLEYWVSGPKRNGQDRHWAGSGPVHIDADVADEYWREIRKCEPPKKALIAN